MTVCVKKNAVSFTRCAADPFAMPPVNTIGKAAYLFMKVAMRPPRMMNGARWA